MLYPYKFNPILKEMIWGGSKIPHKLNLLVGPNVKIGECFALSGLANDLSIVSNGELAGVSIVHLIETYKADLLGQKVYEQFGTNFPLLLKFIDANDDLSIQVHPNDELAKKKHKTFGKTEMWYVMEAEPDATLISGFSKPTSAEEFQSKYASEQLMKLMQKHHTSPGDAFFIPAGKVHSIGSGNLIAEIQQTSDITYRLFDFNRTDKFGMPRELHHELAMEAMNYSDNKSGKVSYSVAPNSTENLVQCSYFTTNVLHVHGQLTTDYSQLDSFVVLMNVGGKCTVEVDDLTISLNEMEAVLVPTVINNLNLKSTRGAKLLEVYV